MTTIEIILLLVGCVFMIGSFFISEKLSSSELNKIAELSEDELKKIIEREVNNAGTQMDDVIEQKIEEAGEQAERAMEKESNEQIMQIHEYSETVMESMKKTHDEIMFLYSMLNDKHTEMTSMTGDLQRLAADIRNLQENMSAKAGTPIRKPVAESNVAQQPVMKQNAVVQPMTETIDVQPEPEVQVNRFQEIQEPEQKTEKPDGVKPKDLYEFDVQSWVTFTQTCGCFVLGSSEVKSAPEALNIYRQKDTVEKAFNNYKDKCGGRRIRCRECALEGKVFITYLSLCLRLMLERRLERAGNDPLNTPRVLERLNSLVLYRHETDEKPKLYWQEIPKEDRLLMERLRIKIPAPIFVI